MSRLIDADAMMKRLEAWNTSDSMDKALYNFALSRIIEQPTIEPERKSGKWVRALDGIDGHVRCDQCFKIYDWDMQAQYYTFCPNCGAKMEEGEQE